MCKRNHAFLILAVALAWKMADRFASRRYLFIKKQTWSANDKTIIRRFILLKRFAGTYREHTKRQVKVLFLFRKAFISGADLRGGCRGCAPPHPPPRDDLLFSNTTGILRKKKTMWFIGVEVEQETSAPPPKKNPGSAPVYFLMFITAVCFLFLLKLRWPKPKSIYDFKMFCFRQTYLNPSCFA